jgi:SAM-dependent methyltransferase
MQGTARKFGVDDPDQYWRDRAAQNRVTEHTLHRLVVQLIGDRFPKDSRVLDCGVGDGHVFRLSRERFKTYGVEFSREAIGRYEFPTDTIACADLNNGIPEFDGTQFEAIVISMVLHWLDNPEEFLRVALKRLSSGGRLMVVIPNITNYRYRLDFLFGRFPPISPSHKNFMTPPESEEMFRRAGCAIERLVASKKGLRARFWPRLFGRSLIYVLRPSR